MTQRMTLAGCLSLLLAGTAQANTLNVSDNSWETIGVPGQAKTQFEVKSDGSLSVISENSVAFRYKELETSGEKLTWRWRVDAMGPPSDPMQVGADDRPIAVHLWFPEQDDQTSLFGVLAELFGYPEVGNALTYTWGGSATHPRTMPNPHLTEGKGALIVLQTDASATGEWTQETIDFQEDFRNAFGKEAPKPSHIAISGDSDDLGGYREGRIADLRFAND